MKRYIQLINYFYLALIILWEPLQRGFLHVDGKGRIVFFLTIGVFLFNVFSDKNFFKKEILSKPAVFWGVWVVYSAINQQITGYYGELSFGYYIVNSLFTPYVVMVISIKETIRNPIKTVKLFTVVFTIYALLAITVLGGSGNPNGRNIGELGNLGPLNTIYIVFFAGLLYVHKRIKLKLLVPLMIFAFAVITMAATRKAFGAAAIIATSLILSHVKLSTKNILATLLFTSIFYVGYNYLMENSTLGERFKEGVEVGEKMNTSNIEALNILGDRARFYINGWELFNEHPITGVGLRNYMHHYDDLNVLHSEYMVQLAECGLIGTLLFLLFYIWIGRELFQLLRKNIWGTRPLILALIGGFCAVLFINFTAWTYQFTQFFAAFGVMIGYIKFIKKYDCDSRYW